MDANCVVCRREKGPQYSVDREYRYVLGIDVTASQQVRTTLTRRVESTAVLCDNCVSAHAEATRKRYKFWGVIAAACLGAALVTLAYDYSTQWQALPGMLLLALFLVVLVAGLGVLVAPVGLREMKSKSAEYFARDFLSELADQWQENGTLCEVCGELAEYDVILKNPDAGSEKIGARCARHSSDLGTYCHLERRPGTQ